MRAGNRKETFDCDIKSKYDKIVAALIPYGKRFERKTEI